MGIRSWIANVVATKITENQFLFSSNHCSCCIPATLYPHPPLPHHHPFSLNSWLMLKWENAFRVKINKEQISKKVSTANQQMMLERLLERPWLQNLALSSWGTSFVDPQFTHLVRMDRMICTHRLNEIMYVKEFNESGDWRRGTWTGHGCDKWVFQACIFLPLFLGGTERNHQKNPNFFWLVMLSSWTTPEPEFQRQMIYPPVYPIIWAGWYLA